MLRVQVFTQFHVVLLSTHFTLFTTAQGLNNLPNRFNQPFNRTLCLSTLTTALNESLVLPNDTTVFHPPFPTGPLHEGILTRVPFCRQICGSKPERKDDCVGRIKEWMWPVLFLIVSVNSTAVISVGFWRALGIYLSAMSDPAAMFRGLLGQLRRERAFRAMGREFCQEVQDRRQRKRRLLKREKRRGLGGVRKTEVTIGQEEIDIGSYTWNDADCDGIMLVTPQDGASSRAVTTHITPAADMVGECEPEPRIPTRSSWEAHRQTSPSQKQTKAMSKSYAIILSAMSKFLPDPETAKGALRHVLKKAPPEIAPERTQDEAILKAAQSLRSGPVGVGIAWISVFACIMDLLFLIVVPLQEQVSASPSGAKVASAAIFTWLLPLVAISAHLGPCISSERAREKLTDLLETLDGSGCTGVREAHNTEVAEGR